MLVKIEKVKHAFSVNCIADVLIFFTRLLKI